MITKDQLRERTIRGLKRMRRELSQIIIDKESWNDNRLDAMPFDVGWDRVMLQKVDACLDAWASGDHERIRISHDELSAVNEERTGH